MAWDTYGDYVFPYQKLRAREGASKLTRLVVVPMTPALEEKAER